MIPVVNEASKSSCRQPVTSKASHPVESSCRRLLFSNSNNNSFFWSKDLLDINVWVSFVKLDWIEYSSKQKEIELQGVPKKPLLFGVSGFLRKEKYLRELHFNTFIKRGFQLWILN